MNPLEDHVVEIVEATTQHPDFVDDHSRTVEQLRLLLLENPALFLTLFGRYMGLRQVGRFEMCDVAFWF
jgi:hypothetical protein